MTNVKIADTLDQIADSIPEFLERLSGLANRLESFASDENVKSFQTTLTNLESMSTSMKKSQSRFDSGLNPPHVHVIFPLLTS